MKFGLSDNVIARICEVLSKHSGIQKAILYGSRAKGNFRPGSDIDLTLLGDVDFSTLARVDEELDDLLLPYYFDLSIFSNITHAELIEHIQRVGATFYEQQPVPAHS